MERWRGRVAVVTGASAGIGAAIAYQLQDAGLTVVALARRRDKIDAAVTQARAEAKERGRGSIGKAEAPGKLIALQCDVSKEDDILAAFKWIKENVGGVDILVNNAGVVGEGKLSEAETIQWRRILDLNVLGLSICTREAIQLMKARGVDDGHIIHIGSISGQSVLSVPGILMYSASKHGVRVLTEGLRKELVAAKSHIRVTEISPGAVKTEILAAAQETSKELPESLQSHDYSLLSHLNAEDVADAVLYVVSTPAHVQIHEIVIHPVGEEF